MEKRGVTLQCLYRDLTFNPWSAQFFKIFEITKAILLHWFAKQQQTSTSRRQQFDLEAAKGSCQNITKPKTVQKTTYTWHSRPNG